MNILHLPEDCLVVIFSFLPSREIYVVPRVCKLFRRLTRDEMLWEGMVLRDFPTASFAETWRTTYRRAFLIPRHVVVTQSLPWPTKARYLRCLTSIDASSDRVAICATYGGAKLFNMKSEALEYSGDFAPSQSEGTSLARFSRRGDVLLTVKFDNQYSLWNVQSKRNLYTGRPSAAGIVDVLFSHDDHQLLIAGNDGKVQVLDRKTMRTAAEFSEPEQKSWSSCDVSDQFQFAGCSVQNRVCVWDMKTSQRLHKLSGIQWVQFVPQFSQVLGVVTHSNTLQLLDLRTRKRSAVQVENVQPNGLFHPSGALFAYFSSAEVIDMVDLVAGKKVPAAADAAEGDDWRGSKFVFTPQGRLVTATMEVIQVYDRQRRQSSMQVLPLW